MDTICDSSRRACHHPATYHVIFLEKMENSKKKDDKNRKEVDYKVQTQNPKNYMTYFKNLSFMPMKPCILLSFLYELSSNSVKPLQLTLCHQRYTISIQYISTVYQVFFKPAQYCKYCNRSSYCLICRVIFFQLLVSISIQVSK